jgi:hypothetical protein
VPPVSGPAFRCLPLAVSRPALFCPAAGC